MKLHKAKIDKIVSINGLRPVTNVIALDKGLPALDGLFDPNIFGQSTKDRRNIPAFIDLKGHYLHPLTYINLKMLNRKFESVVAGVGQYIINDKGELQEVDKDGDTGLDFLYNNWDKINFKERSSVFATQRIENIKDKKISWVDKWLVLPAFFRDLNFNEEGRPSYDEINDKYLNIIRMVSSVTQQEQYGLASNLTRARVQMTINEIHDRFVDSQMRQKHGVFKRYVMGKNIDYGARLVISAHNIQGAETYEDVPVRFNKIGIPLASVCSIFFPFVVYNVREYLQNEFQLAGKYTFTNEDGSVDSITLKNPDYFFSDEHIIKMIKKFIYGVNTRFDPIELPENYEGRKGYVYFVGKFGREHTTISRPITWTDILYRICHDRLADKHVYFTRYPIEDSFGINPSKFTVMSTKKTEQVMIGDKYYPNYPMINIDKDSSTSFIDTLLLSNAYLIGLGADFDGDMLTVTGVYTNEANQDAENYTKDKKYILNLTGSTNRMIQRDLVQTIYSLTKIPKGEGIPEFKNLSRVAKF